jgi:hypothetical protein
MALQQLPGQRHQRRSGITSLQVVTPALACSAHQGCSVRRWTSTASADFLARRRSQLYDGNPPDEESADPR